MARRRKKKQPTKVQRLERRLAAVEWALVQAREAGAALEAELLRVVGALEVKTVPHVVVRERVVDELYPIPPPHQDEDAPPPEPTLERFEEAP